MRVFIAVEFNAKVKDYLHELQREIRKRKIKLPACICAKDRVKERIQDRNIFSELMFGFSE